MPRVVADLFRLALGAGADRPIRLMREITCLEPIKSRSNQRRRRLDMKLVRAYLNLSSELHRRVKPWLWRVAAWAALAHEAFTFPTDAEISQAAWQLPSGLSKITRSGASKSSRTRSRNDSLCCVSRNQ